MKTDAALPEWVNQNTIFHKLDTTPSTCILLSLIKTAIYHLKISHNSIAGLAGYIQK